MLWDLGFVAAGLVLLFVGGEALVRGAVSLADRFDISKVVVGTVIVGFGTSAPELVVSVEAALAGSPDIAVGNIVGSNIANILLIIGVAALIAPLSNGDSGIRRDTIIMVVVSIGAVLLFQVGEIGRIAGLAMVALLALYLALTYYLERKRAESAFTHEADELEDIPLSGPLATGAILIGFISLAAGADFLVDGASGIARIYGVSEAVIGLTIVAIGTSLPELATAIVAAVRRHADVVLANVIGSNIFNILCILGIASIITPIPVATRFATMDGPVMVAISIVAIAIIFAMGVVGRLAGALLLAAYIGYLVMLGMPA